MSATEDALARERDAKFKAWLQNKALKDKAFEFLARLDSSRAVDEDSLIEVGVSLCAVDRLLGGDDAKKSSNQDAGTSAKKTLKSAWFRWAMEYHSFSMIHLSDAEVSGLSGGVREFLTSESDLIASGGNYGEELERASRVKNILPSLKYFFPAVPKPNEKAKPLTNDQKAQNLIFMREARKLWRKAEDELNNRVVEHVAKTMKAGGKKGSILSGQNSVADNAEGEMNSKGRAADMEADSRADSGKFVSPEERMTKMKRIEAACLQELGVVQLKLWLDQDQEAVDVRANEKAMDKLNQAKISHEQFVKKKDGLRIRMPESMPAVSIPSMGYGRELTGVRAAVKGVGTTVDLMAGMGLKYVHATNKGRKGQMGDLEKSRDQLLKMGFINKANFDEEDKHLYDREKRENAVLTERAATELKTKQENTRAYDEWIVQKELRDSALKCLGLVPRPVVDMPVLQDDVRGSAVLRKSGGSIVPAGATSNPMQNPSLSRHCMDIGRALKKVDRTTFLDWARWCEGVFTVNTAQVLWDFFPPVACDVHCASYSQVRDTFLKLLRPGVDFRQTFMDYVESHIFARRINRFKDEKDYYTLRDDAQAEVDEELESMRKEWLSEVSLSKADMHKLLLQMGISLKETEMRALIDAFDVNGDGAITIQEFLEFTGPKRDKRSGNSVVMSQRCCWLTTCRVTGMAGAYSVSAPTKRSQKQEESKSSDDMYYHRTVAVKSRGGSAKYDNNQDEEIETASKTAAAASTLGAVNIVVRALANGEKRMCIELRERKKREELLRKMGLIDDAGKPLVAGKDNKHASAERKSKSAHDKHNNAGDDEYGDEFETSDNEEPDYDNDFEDHSPNDKKKALNKSSTNLNATGSGNSCEYSAWDTARRRAGLKFLLDLTKSAREEETLKVLLANGVPPAPPKLWVQNEHFVETKSLNRRSVGSVSTIGGGKRGSGNNNKGRSESKFDATDEENDENNDNNSTAPECTEISLFWGAPNKGDLVSFYSLEYGGVVGNTKSNDVKYVEIFRDPEDANPSTPFACNYCMRDLTPGASYRFRLRAFNGFGAGEYTYKTFTTLTAAPATPRVIKTCSDSVTLKWTFTQGFFRRIEELKRIFTLADSDKSGVVSREELTLLLDERASTSPELKNFLNRVAGSVGIVVAQGYDALFDMIECDDDGGLSWAEFEAFFMAAGWGNSAPTGGTTNASFVSGGIANQNQSTLKPSTGPAGAGIAIAPGDINYVVERCESELDDKYVEVMRTTLGYGTLTRLDPGKSYRFRIHSLNADGVAGPPSPPVTVHTLVETPAAPVAPAKFVNARKVTLIWKARNTFTGTRNKAFTDKMLNEWAGALGDDEAGVSIRAAFDKYDRDGSGDIDSAELRCVLEDLGVDASDERLNEAFELLDRNGDGIISYEEFGKWWRRDAVSYTLKRSEEVIPLNSALYNPLDNGTNRFKTGNFHSAGSQVGTTAPTTVPRGVPRQGREGGGMAGIAEEQSVGRSVSRGGTRPQSTTGREASPVPTTSSARQVAVPIVTYRGDRTRFEVKGLTPNRLYHFRLRYVGSRSNSVLSPPLLLMTAPLPTTAPILVDVTAQTVRVKWYPGQFGAFKFVVQMRLESAAGSNGGNNTTLNTTNAATRKVATGLVGADTGEDGWIAVYNGVDNVFTAPSLASATAYQVRVLAVNCQGNVSEPSDVVNFTTLPRTEVSALTPKNAGARFTIECTADICIGDVILITERLYVKNRPSSASATARDNVNLRASINSTSSAMRGKSPARGRLNASAPAAGAKSGQINPNMSVTSLNGMGLDAGASITASRGEYLGERTIAAYVARDNYRTIRDALATSGVEPRHHKTFGVHRKLWLEVVWQRTSDEACKPYDLKSGEVLERMQSHLEQFEVFRCAWREENKRKPLQEEWRAMMECFVQTDC